MRGDALGPLHGVPVSVKDLIDVAGLPARYGSLTMKDNVARVDAPSVERLRRAGAIILGKTATPEFGYRAYTKSLVHKHDFRGALPVADGDTAVVETDDPAAGDGDAEHVARQILQHRVGAVAPGRTVDDPGFAPHGLRPR
jgi:hypothetical protein